MFDPAEIHVILAASKPPLTTMILLGLNCGFGNHDCAMLTVGKIDIARPWIAFARPKTGVYRECPLWSETAAALAPFLDGKGAGEHVFLRPRGGLWFSEDRSHSPIAQAFCRAQKAAGVYRLGRGFYSLRHTFETVGGEAKDQATVDYIMGHAPHASDMSAVYRERMLPERLLAVTQHVHDWLYAPSAERLPAGHPPDGQPDCAAPQAPRP
jgi:integrase